MVYLLKFGASWVLPPIWITCPSPIQCLTLTRVLEEALTNVIKHSRASQVQVRLEIPDARELQLQIEDNGTGFDLDSTQINSMGVGMRSMLARLERQTGLRMARPRSGLFVPSKIPTANVQGHIHKGYQHRHFYQRANNSHKGLARIEAKHGNGHGNGQLKVVGGSGET